MAHRGGATAEKQITEDARTMLGDPKRALRMMAVPMLVSLLVAQVNSFVDTFWCSSLGSIELAAVGLVAPFYLIISGIGSGVGIGVSASIAAKVALGKKDAADAVATQSLTFMAVVGVMLTPIFLLTADPIAMAVGGEETYDECVAYGLPYYLMAVFIVLQGVAAGILRGEGASRRSMVMLSLAAAVNIVFDPLLAFGLGWGIAGLAWATVLSIVVSLVPFVRWYWFRSDTTYVDIVRSQAVPRKDVLRDFLSVGVPKAVELDIMSVMNFPLNYFVVKCAGSLGFAIYATAWKYVDLMLVPSMALGGALVPICAAAFQRADLSKARTAYWYAIVWAVGVTAVEALLLLVCDQWAATLFTYSDASIELRDGLAESLRIYAFIGLFYSIINVSSSFLQSMGMANSSMWCTLARNVMLLFGFWWASGYDFAMIRWVFLVCEIIGFFMMSGWAELGFSARARYMGRRKNPGV